MRLTKKQRELFLDIFLETKVELITGWQLRTGFILQEKLGDDDRGCHCMLIEDNEAGQTWASLTEYFKKSFLLSAIASK